DAGTDATFQAMHRPRSPITLQAICEVVPQIKAANDTPRVGFSFVITWPDAMGAEDGPDNVDEIPIAARLARAHGFDYVSFKPVLVRTETGAEVMDPAHGRSRHEETLRRIRTRLDEARRLAGDGFAVLESTNLRLLEAGTWKDWTRQPRTCHFQAFRQVLSPLGLWNCPAHRGVDKARIADPGIFAGPAGAASSALARMLAAFDAAHECRDVTCLYHQANWWIEEAIEGRRDVLAPPVEDGEDYFL
ncbi:MAG: hypothetical protein ACC662_11510, partial [Planctomycetota bacterium]